MAIVPATANRQDEAHADIHARGYEGDIRVPFLMVGLFTKIHLVIGPYERHEQKKREYGDCITLGRFRRPLFLPSFCNHWKYR